MTETQQLKEQARAMTRSLLSQSQSFRALDREEQMSLYRDLSAAHYNDLAEAQGLATAMATGGDLINEERHVNARIGKANQNAGDIMGNLVDKVDFPGFVSDLLNGVFNANLTANIKQMEAFQNLLKEATQSLSKFANSISDDEAMMRLVETNNQFKLKMLDAQSAAKRRGGRGGRREKDKEKPTNQLNQQNNTNQDQGNTTQDTGSSGGERKAVLMDQNGKEVNMNDNAILAKILDAKLAMAKERRTMLRETLLMGVSRLVVEKGIIRASVKFKIEASENTYNYDEGEANRSNTVWGQAGYSAGIFGGVHASAGFSHTNSQISLATSETEKSTDLSAELEGFVEIQFKSDYFKLDNFKDTFDLGQGRTDAPAQLPAGATPGTAPPAA